MKTRIARLAVACGFLGAAAFAVPNRLSAQAPPGPLAPAPGLQPAPSSQPVARPKPAQVPARTSLDGDWKLNRDESDDPRRKVEDPNSNGGQYPGGGYPGGGYPGGGYPGRVGFPGGGYPGGGYPGGGYPGGGYPGNGPYGNERNNQRLEQLIRPAASLTIALKGPEIDVTDDQYHKLALFTDGRQLQKTKDENYQEIAAHWEGSRLVSDEKSPQGGKMSRSFELSQDGRQFYETFNIDQGRSRGPLIVRYVYDVAGAETTPVDESSDPDRPTLKRRSEAGDNSAETTSGSTQNTQGQSNGTSDPDRPVLKRSSPDSDAGSNGNNSGAGGNDPSQDSQAQSGGSGTSANSQTQSNTSSTAPDPNQPTLKRRSDNSDNSSQ